MEAVEKKKKKKMMMMMMMTTKMHDSMNINKRMAVAVAVGREEVIPAAQRKAKDKPRTM
ncbi:hypothetical protein M569_01811 [Genlisea aurea]|uniref:Uncharacterized protein n=1 Tax=Genlisea aurea TaxID=192259 RepID=S8CZN3_9LAMI|nr:hypothetical protein M569_01811 [Genlisea aurea]